MKIRNKWWFAYFVPVCLLAIVLLPIIITSVGSLLLKVIAIIWWLTGTLFTGLAAKNEIQRKEVSDGNKS